MQTISDASLPFLLYSLLNKIQLDGLQPSANQIATALLDVFSELPEQTSEATHYKLLFCIAGLIDLAERHHEIWPDLRETLQ